MLTKFWDGLGEGLAEKWLSQALSPAFLFWAAGVVAWGLRFGFQPLRDLLTHLDVIRGAVLLAALFFLLYACNLLVQRLLTGLLRALEGYWPRWLNQLRASRSQKAVLAWLEDDYRRGELAALYQGRGPQALSTVEHWEWSELEMKVHYTPVEPEQFMPTRLGNILRNAERAPRLKYGLDAIVCWPRLWVLMPDIARQELIQARNSLNQAVNMWFWGLLSMAWALLLFWPPFSLGSLWGLLFILLGFLEAWLAYRLALDAAMTYADLLEAAFDLYRWELYRVLHWPLPEKLTPYGERQIGLKLSQYLWRGLEGNQPVFQQD